MSVVLLHSIPLQRFQYLMDLGVVWTQINQIIFVDEKKFVKGDALHNNELVLS